ncbi:DUF3040 domain-containing protein [Streptomyces sp. Tu 2975]|uniref:DUF3040 domain-containing protein n=1 Tax=Streptomyces sp. Tu 2975 TaxID=2676871 RepID=UPI00135B87C8|nr:DUF3040 domain-containing protein [Streptomyces sp. Tu 2975]QIP86778.1 DUF3040 domain-containing protein [Streptomyces sp. Tu 2975]
MTEPDIDPLHDLEAQTRRSDPRFAHGLRTAHPRRPREYRRRRGRAWALLVLASAMLVTGMVLPQGLLLASGLVVAGMATSLLDPPKDPGRRPELPLHAPARPVPAANPRA